jgi:hypothetical protein
MSIGSAVSEIGGIALFRGGHGAVGHCAEFIGIVAATATAAGERECSAHHGDPEKFGLHGAPFLHCAPGVGVNRYGNFGSSGTTA